MRFCRQNWIHKPKSETGEKYNFGEFGVGWVQTAWSILRQDSHWLISIIRRMKTSFERVVLMKRFHRTDDMRNQNR